MAAAVSLEPVMVEMGTTGSNATATLRLDNDTARAVPVQFHVTRITLDKDGNRVNLGDDGNFLIIPDQPLLQANTEQVVRVQWVGEQEISETQTYIITAEQLPIALDAVNSGIEIVINYNVVVNVVPTASSGTLEVVETGVTVIDGKRLARVTLRNSGNRHILVGTGSARLAAQGWSVDLAMFDLRKTMGLGLLLPGKERVYVLDAEVPGDVTQYTAEFSGLKTN